MEKAKSILFSNLYLLNRTGSELHILELAKAFKRSGWEVTCYALVVGYPLQAAFEAACIKLVKFGHEEQLDNSYDVFLLNTT